MVPTYAATTQVLSIAKLGVPSGEAGYAYQVDTKLFSTDPIGFVVSNLNLIGAVGADEELSAVYQVESHSIYFPNVIIINTDGTQTELKEVRLSLGADPFVWFYLP